MDVLLPVGVELVVVDPAVIRWPLIEDARQLMIVKVIALHEAACSTEPYAVEAAAHIVSLEEERCEFRSTPR